MYFTADLSQFPCPDGKLVSWNKSCDDFRLKKDRSFHADNERACYNEKKKNERPLFAPRWPQIADSLRHKCISLFVLARYVFNCIMQVFLAVSFEIDATGACVFGAFAAMRKNKMHLWELHSKCNHNVLLVYSTRGFVCTDWTVHGPIRCKLN